MAIETEKEYEVTPTLKQREAFRYMQKALSEKKDLNWGSIMRKAGYSLSASKNPGNMLLSRRGFQILLAQINDGIILARLLQILTDGKDRDSLSAANVLLKLKNRFPDSKIKIGPYKERERVFETDD